MWFIFPQLKGLGFRDCGELLLIHNIKPINKIMGYPDNLKLQSSVTLFLQVAPNNLVLQQVLAQFYHNQPDKKTIELLAQLNTKLTSLSRNS